MIDIKLLRESDASVLDRITDGVFDEPVTKSWLNEFLANPNHHLAVASDDQLIIGMASAVHYVHPDKPVELWINELGVAPSYQRQGIATRLMQTLFDLAVTLGAKEAWVLTEPENTAARRLYQTAQGKESSCLMYSFSLGAD